MKNMGELVCAVLAGGFVILVINAKAQRAGGWGNYLLGFLIMFGVIFAIGLVAKACKALS